MTNTRNSQQGEGTAGGVCRPFRPAAQRWVAEVLYPAACGRFVVELHTTPEKTAYLVSFEVNNPHTKELLGMIVDPNMTFVTATHMAEHAAEVVRQAILHLFDPEPF